MSPMLMMLSREVRREPRDYEPPRDANGWVPTYAQDWPEGADLGIRMYETVTEGTPISAWHPDTPQGREDLAQELAFHGGGGIADDLSAGDWRQIIAGGLGLKNIHTGEVDVR